MDNYAPNAFDIDSIESYESIVSVFQEEYNRIDVVFDKTHILPENINQVDRNCSETLHIYSITKCKEKDRIKVSFEF